MPKARVEIECGWDDTGVLSDPVALKQAYDTLRSLGVTRFRLRAVHGGRAGGVDVVRPEALGNAAATLIEQVERGALA